MNAAAPYPEYADSGDRWLGILPSHWTTPALCQIAKIRNGSDFKSVETDSEEAIPVIGSGGIFARATHSLFDGESVLLGRKGTIDRPLYWNGPFWTVDTMFYTEIGSRLHPKFFYYFCARIDFSFYSTNTALPSMASSDLKAIRVALPPLGEQRQIADYLDRETGQIDALITKQEQLVETLTERRQAVISHAVTKGLDPNVTMKGSRVEWVGDAPAHWEVGNIRRFASMRTGHTPSRSHPEYWTDCHIPWFTLADVWQLRKGQRYLGETNGAISELGLANSAADLLPAGTVVLSRTASVGFTGIMPVAMATSQDYWNWICRPELDPTYLWFQFYAMRPHFASLVQGSTHKTIYQTDAAALKITAPPINEQRQIVDYLDHETAKIDTLSAKAREIIDMLKERRQALISAAVTGKIDVRGL